jgi:competence protein ComEC
MSFQNTEGTAAPDAPAERLAASAGHLRRYYGEAAWRFGRAYRAICAVLSREREAGGFRNLTPVFIGIGAALYLLAPREPNFGLLLAGLSLTGLAAMRFKKRGAAFLLLCTCALIFLGMASAQLRTKFVGGPVLAGSYTGHIVGEVVWRDFSAGGRTRYLIRPVEMENLPPEQRPRRIRLTASAGHEAFALGELISGLASIRPYSGPLIPHGYDFSFANWFDGLGGAGFFMGKPQHAGRASASRTLWEWAELLQNRIRLEIGRKIRAALKGEQGEVAVALITGDRSGMGEPVQESLRQSGLAHILAISGLHMALVTMTVFWTLRFMLALFPQVALRYPIRKWAATIGLVAATAYLLISGASIATQRAWIMLCVMLIAILVDRRAVTIRNVVLSATVILLLSPESFLQPGFQMSFAAATALVAAYSDLNLWRERRRAKGGFAGASRGLVVTLAIYAAGLGLTSLIAGIATAPFSAWHFHRVAPLGLVANLLAMPIVSFAVIPLALSSALLMPFGLEQYALYPLGSAINTVIEISGTVNGLAPEFGTVGTLSVPFLLCSALGLALITLLSTPLRWLGLVPIFCLLFVTDRQPPPDLIVSEDGRAVAFRDTAGRLSFPYPKRAKFVTDIWRRAWPSDGTGNPDTILRCDNDLCLSRAPSGLRMAIVYAPDSIEMACDYADILVAPRLRWIRCRSRIPTVVLTREDFEWHGTHMATIEHPGAEALDSGEFRAINIHGHSIFVKITATRPYRDRPWVAKPKKVSTFAKVRRAGLEP